MHRMNLIVVLCHSLSETKFVPRGPDSLDIEVAPPDLPALGLTVTV
jgi:hypothetical protein